MNYDNMVLVVGTNLAGIHAAGAAKTALMKFGAVWGEGFGHFGNSFAIPTKDENIETMKLIGIRYFVTLFILYAKKHPELCFKVTRIGCGLAGLRNRDVAPMFINAPDNCYFDEAWVEYLPDETRFWGTF